MTRKNLQALKRNTWIRFAVLWLASYAVLLGFFCNTMLSDSSYIEIFPSELLLPLFMHAVTALLIALALFWLPQLRDFAAKMISAVVLSLAMVDYDSNLHAVSGVIRAFIPGFTDNDPLPVVSLVYLALLVALAVFLGAWLSRMLARVKQIRPVDVQLGVAVLVAFLFVPSFVGFAQVFPDMVRESQVIAPALGAPTAQADKPDIFYIVLDRYANQDTLTNQFHYDNSNFTGFLRDNGFAVNDTAYGNYPYTTMSISSTLNAQYTNQLVAPFVNANAQSRTLYHNLIWQSPVVRALKQIGYSYYSIGSSYQATYHAPLADREYMWEHKLTVLGQTKNLRGIEATEFAKSPYYQLAQVSLSWWPVHIAERSHIDDVRTQITALNDLTTKEQPGGRFIFAHILVPHGPYSFNADGSLSAYDGRDSVGRPLKEKYLQQLQFINTYMQQLVTNINKQSDGKAVIIFNADEGPYPQFMNSTFVTPQPADKAANDFIGNVEDMRQWSDDWVKMKFGVLQAAHIPRATADDMSHLSSVNAFRIVLNRYAGLNLDYLPECHFGLTSGSVNEYTYADITSRFVATPDPSCKQMQTQP